MNESPQQAGLPMSLAGLMVLYVCVCIIPSPQLADGYLGTAIIQQVFKQQ